MPCTAPLHTELSGLMSYRSLGVDLEDELVCGGIDNFFGDVEVREGVHLTQKGDVVLTKLE